MQGLTDDERGALLADLLGGRANRRHRPGRGLESLRYRFEIVSDYGAFRDLQRHRMLTCQWQALTPDLGAGVPHELDDAGAGDDYRRALATAIREYEALGQQRQDLDKRLAEVMQTIGTLSRLCGLVPTVPIGLTDACRLVVRGAGVPVTPAEVRQRLQAIGFDLTKYANDLAAIHTILKRLNDAGELRFVPRTFAPMGGRDSATHAYIWNQGRHVVALGADIKAFMRDADLEREASRAHDEPDPARTRTRTVRPQKRSRRT